MGATFPHATSVQNRLADQRRNVRQRIARIKRKRRFHIPSFLDQVFGSLPVACTRPESPPTTPPKRPWALCVGSKLECVWPGNSGYHIQITSVHRLAIGFPSLPAGLYTHIPRRSGDAKKQIEAQTPAFNVASNAAPGVEKRREETYKSL